MIDSVSMDVTKLLEEWSEGNQQALNDLLPMIYEQLHGMARRYMSGQNAGHTLQTTALINEAYLRLANQEDKRFQNRAHFFAVAAQAMRQILVSHARKTNAEKRGGANTKISLEDVAVISKERASEMVALDEALIKLSDFDERKSRVVELRYFGGLTIEETAEVLKISQETVMRDWRFAKTWLLRELSGH